MAALIYGDVKEWRAEPLRTAAEDVKKDADALEESRDEVESTVPSSWLGPPSGLAAVRRDRLVKLMNTHLEGKRQVQKALEQATDQVAEVERLVEEVKAQARSHDFGISDDGLVNDKRTGPPFSTPEYWQWYADRNEKAAPISANIRTIVSLASAADATIIKSIPRGHFWNLDEYGTASPEVARYWASLTDPEREAIFDQLVEELAKENGIDPSTIELVPGRSNDPSVLGAAAYVVRVARQREVVFDMNDLNDWTWPWEDNPFDRYEEDGILEQAEKWKEDFEDFWIGPSEEDARDAQRECVEEMTKAKLKRLLEESRR